MEQTDLSFETAAPELQEETFGARLRRIRKEMGLSQEAFAEKIGTSKQVLSRYEIGQRTPKITQVEQYAKALQVSVDYLMGDSTDESAFGSVCRQSGKPFYQIFIDVTMAMGLDIPGIVRVTGLTDRQVRTIIMRRMKEAPLPIALQLSNTLDVPIELWTGGVEYVPKKITAEALEVARAYDSADQKDKTAARVVLDLPIIQEGRGL